MFSFGRASAMAYRIFYTPPPPHSCTLSSSIKRNNLSYYMEAMIEKMRHDDSAHVAYGLRLRAENATLAESLEEFHRNAVMAADLMVAALTQFKKFEELLKAPSTDAGRASVVGRPSTHSDERAERHQSHHLRNDARTPVVNPLADQSNRHQAPGRHGGDD